MKCKLEQCKYFRNNIYYDSCNLTMTSLGTPLSDHECSALDYIDRENNKIQETKKKMLAEEKYIFKLFNIVL